MTKSMIYISTYVYLFTQKVLFVEVRCITTMRLRMVFFQSYRKEKDVTYRYPYDFISPP